LGKLNKWLPIEEIIKDINTDRKEVPEELYEMAEKVFGSLNSILRDENV